MKKLLLLFLLLSGVGLAQQTTINGSEHPELIPDAAATQAVFKVHSMLDTPAKIASAAKQQAKIGLSPADLAAYQAAMQTYFAANKQNASATMAGLLSTLSPDGQAKLKAFIQSEKKTMQYHTQPAVAQ